MDDTTVRRGRRPKILSQPGFTVANLLPANDNAVATENPETGRNMGWRNGINLDGLDKGGGNCAP